MTEFIKKVVVLDQTANGFGIANKQVSGVLKVQKSGQKLFAGIYIANFCKNKAEFFEYVLMIGKKIYCDKSDLCEFEIKIDKLQQSDEVACLVSSTKNDKGVPFLFGATNSKITADMLAQHLCHEQMTQYEEFVCATDNYFEQDSTQNNFDLHKLKQQSISKFKPIELLSKCKQTQDQTFFANAHEVLLKIFESYPPCDELNDNMPDSFWVKVPFKDNKYFSVGVLQQMGKPRYIAYGVPGKLDRPPDDDGFAFFATKHKDVGFWIICQDAMTGFSAQQPYFWV